MEFKDFCKKFNVNQWGGVFTLTFFSGILARVGEKSTLAEIAWLSLIGFILVMELKESRRTKKNGDKNKCPVCGDELNPAGATKKRCYTCSNLFVPTTDGNGYEPIPRS
jgi:hypothetical protein